ncbi:MAG: hypothetical protein KDD56_07395 [Bdellovibrionales bacterium]|nr:hypothetical protein [Bdellovibrionales bacterium]
MKQLILAFLFSTILSPTAIAETNGFLPTWKMLNSQEKQYFISGYLHAWQDASEVTDIAISFIKDNPKKAVESMESIKGLYNVSGINPITLAARIDEFFTNPENKDASLSRAVSFAKNRAN